MGWTEADAHRSNRRWILVTVALLLIPVLLWSGAGLVPYAWSWTMWNSKVAGAQSISDYARVPADASYSVVVTSLGDPLYSGPGFENSYGPVAGVYYWRDADGKEIRGLVMDWTRTGNAKLVGSLKAGVW